MRNYWEGHFTLWHHDIAYPHLHSALRRLYPDLRTLPSVAEAEEWRKRYQKRRDYLHLPFAKDRKVLQTGGRTERVARLQGPGMGSAAAHVSGADARTR